MLKRVTIRIKSGGAFQLPLKQEEIDRLLNLCESTCESDVGDSSERMFNINTLVIEEKQDINTQIWVKLKEIDCVVVETVSNITTSPKGILVPK